MQLDNVSHGLIRLTQQQFKVLKIKKNKIVNLFYNIGEYTLLQIYCITYYYYYSSRSHCY